MRGYVCVDSLEGIFTGIYRAWASGLGHENVRLFLEGEYEPELFTEYEQVEAEPEKAEKVAGSIRRKISAAAFFHVCRCALSREPDRADAVYRFLIPGFRHGAEILSMLQLPAVERVFSLSRRVGNEAHKYLEFIRFKQTAGGVLLARIAPRSRVLPLVAPHFADRLSGEAWVIYDETRREAAVHGVLEEWYLARLSTEEAEKLRDLPESGDGYEKLWKTFFRAVSIKERENPRCQRNFLPLWMRRYMTEFQK